MKLRDKNKQQTLLQLEIISKEIILGNEPENIFELILASKFACVTN